MLDDVWDNIELRDIGLSNPLPKGVKLLLTSRKLNICTQIAASVRSDLQEVRVDILKEREAQIFFSQIAGISEEQDHELYRIGCYIVKKCGYLPLAIKLIATALNSKKDYVWRDTYGRLKSRIRNDHFDDVLEIVRISYEYMKKDEQRIFLHCGLFPEDSNIPIEDLRRHAWGLKLFEEISTLKESRDRINTCVHNLIDANLLMNGDHIGYVKMHDLVLDFVLDEVSKGDHAWIINHGDVSNWEKNERGESCKSISLTCRGVSEFPTNIEYPNLSLLQLIHGDALLNIPDGFYENAKNLKVIAYYRIPYQLLPKSLTNLTTLCLHKCQLVFDCSFVGDLVNLEMLSFAYSDICKLPSTIGNLRNLKLLDLTGCINLLIDDGVFNNLVNLEELYMRVQYSSSVRFTKANLEELNMLSSKLCALEVEFVEQNTWPENFSFMKLDEFKISIGCTFWIKHKDERSFRKMLKLATDATYLRDSKISELITKADNLHLQVTNMIRLEDIVSIGPSNQRPFCNLRDLEVSNCTDLKYLFPIYVASGLRKLERLKISACLVLEALVHIDRSDIISVNEIINFEELKYLSLENLPKLVSLFPVENVVKLPQLIELNVDMLPNFTSIYPNKNSNSALQQSFFTNQVRISRLMKLSITSMVKLKHIWSCEIDSEERNIMSTLTEINVDKCDSLTNIFPTNPMPLFQNLEKVWVKRCGSIKELFNIDLKCKSEDEQLNSRGMLRSIEVYESQNLRDLWRIKGGENNSGLLISGFEGVESITIKECERFKNVFTPTNTKLDLRSLTRISINCYTFCIPENELPPKKERDDNISTVAVPFNMMYSFSKLQELELSGYEDVEVVFETERSLSSTYLVAATNNQQPLLPNLRKLGVYGAEKMSHVWKCNNQNNFLVLQNQSSFHNLTTIEMSYCNRIKYLFSPLMATLLSNLKSITIKVCDVIEEVVSNRDDKHENEVMVTSTNFFPHLQSLSFENLKNLKRIGGGGADNGITGITHNESTYFQVRSVSWSLSQYSREIHIYDCESLMEVFETQGTNDTGGDGGITSTSIHERIDDTNSPRRETWNAPQLLYLKKLVIMSCNLLKHVFVFTTIESLTQLEEIRIQECEAMEVIVKNENEEQRKIVKFPRLKSLNLVDLPNLKGFFLGINEFQWPQLENVTISNCPQIMVFTRGASITSKLKYIHTSLGKHSFDCGLNFHVTTPHQTQLPSSDSTSMCSATFKSLPWSFHNLIEINMHHNFSAKNIIPSAGLLQLQKLERIQAYSCYDVEEVFEVEAMEGINMSETQTLISIPKLTEVMLHDLGDLLYIWKNNNHVLKFPNLTKLSVDYCDRLNHVLTSSMVGSLLQLKELRVSSSDYTEIIVKEEEFEFECDTKVKEIVSLPCLKSIELENLASLKGFCLGNNDFSCPLLDTLEIINCPEITHFTNGDVATPSLHVIDTNFGRCYVKEDLNSFIKAKRDEGFQF